MSLSDEEKERVIEAFAFVCQSIGLKLHKGFIIPEGDLYKALICKNPLLADYDGSDIWNYLTREGYILGHRQGAELTEKARKMRGPDYHGAMRRFLEYPPFSPLAAFLGRILPLSTSGYLDLAQEEARWLLRRFLRLQCGLPTFREFDENPLPYELPILLHLYDQHGADYEKPSALGVYATELHVAKKRSRGSLYILPYGHSTHPQLYRDASQNYMAEVTYNPIWGEKTTQVTGRTPEGALASAFQLYAREQKAITIDPISQPGYCVVYFPDGFSITVLAGGQSDGS